MTKFALRRHHRYGSAAIAVAYASTSLVSKGASAQETMAGKSPAPATVPVPGDQAPGASIRTDQPLSTIERLRVKKFRFEGNTVFSSSELEAVTSPYLNRDITSDDLEEARRQLTLYYVQKGYINSGALLKDQTITDGEVTFSIVEGMLSQIEVSGNRRYRRSFLERQIHRVGAPPFNVTRIRDQLEILRQNPNISRINADVQPGTKPGLAVLHVDVEENDPIGVAFQFDNQRPASIGAERLSLITGTTNLTGRDDALNLRIGLTKGGTDHPRLAGLDDYALAYKSPPFLGDNNLLVNFGRNDAAVIEEPFRSLDISSRFENYSLGVRHIQRKTLEDEISFSMILEHRRSQTYLSGEPFSFSRGDVNGEAQTTALRFGEDYLSRNQNRVLAARALVSVDAGFPGSTHSAGNSDNHFIVALGQAQYVKVLGDSGRQLLLRTNSQYASRPLLTVEQFSLGGADSVRGYRENQLVRDVGFTASAELRFPIARAKSGQNILVLAPFTDFGYGKNLRTSVSTGPNSISSVGLGALYTPGSRLNAQIYYGYPLRDISSSGHDLQDKGVTFSLIFKLR